MTERTTLKDEELGCPTCGATWTEMSSDDAGNTWCENSHRLRTEFWRKTQRKRKSRD